MNYKDVAVKLCERIEEVLHYLLPEGEKHSNDWCVGSINGERGQSLKIFLSGPKIGRWKDFATEEGGDILDLWSAVRRIDLYLAYKEALKYLGIGQNYIAPIKEKNYQKPTPKLLQQFSSLSPIKSYLIKERCLSELVISYFGICEEGRDIVFPFYRDNELISVKYLSIDRIDGKKKIRSIANCEPCLFGWHTIPKSQRFIVLCEGEIDAMSLYQYGIPSLSVPNGASGLEWVQYEYDRLAAFDKIYICFDNDNAGNKGVQALIERLGRHRCFVVNLPFKDANECLQNNVTYETIKECFIEAKTQDPEELKFAKSFAYEVIELLNPVEKKQKGILLPWEKCKDTILLRPNDLSLWTGINGHGKSQILGQIALGAIEQGAKVCIASLEMRTGNLLLRLTRQAAGLRMPSNEYVMAIHEWYGENLLVFDHLGSVKIENLLSQFEYAHLRYGFDFFIIDSLMKLDVLEDDYNNQKAVVDKICQFKHKYNCHIHLVAHPRKGADEKKPPGKLDIRGAGAISDLADNCFAVWRNKPKEELLRKATITGNIPDKETIERYDALLICDKQRNGEQEDTIALWFNKDSYQYVNYYGQKPRQYVQYSNQI